jgi:hypothetical protein
VAATETALAELMSRRLDDLDLVPTISGISPPSITESPQ